MKYFINRELSWMDFNERVLWEACNPLLPFMERLNFLSITASNLDEFCMVRVAKLINRINRGEDDKDASEYKPSQLLPILKQRITDFQREQDKVYDELKGLLKEQGIHILSPDQLSDTQTAWLKQYFVQEVLPVLTPRVPDSAFPFPHLNAKTIHIACSLINKRTGKTVLGLVDLPEKLSRFVLLPMGKGDVRGILLEDLISLHLDLMFPGASIDSLCVFRLTRNTDYLLDISSSDTILAEMEKIIKQRPYGHILRVEVQKGANEETLDLLLKSLQVKKDTLVSGLQTLDYRFLSKTIYKLPGYGHLRYEPYQYRTANRLMQPESIFRTIRGGDVFFHHPYDSYEPIVKFISDAADDSRVLAIKQTLYRVSGNSPFIAALVRAAQKGKQVTVLVEVRARFDEVSNIEWAHALDKAGVHVLYGFPAWKTHSKISLVVRREETGIRSYLHLGTGNYNDATAKGYTDLSLLTCNRQLAKDANAFFNLLAGYPGTMPIKELIASPYSFRRMLEEKFAGEKENAKNGKPAYILAKMNQLSDPGIVANLLDAAEAGVKIDLVVRGICCLQVPEHRNIRVRSILGRFLEHARIFVFYQGGAVDTYISSADWMTRNIDRRIELTVPIYDQNVKERILSILAIQLNPEARAWHMQPDGSYTLNQGFDTQSVFMRDGYDFVDFSSLFLYDKYTVRSEE